jgi:phage gp16-like protein
MDAGKRAGGAVSVNPARRARLAKVHIAKKQLNLDDENYRTILDRITGHSSSADCSDLQLDELLTEFGRLGFVTTKNSNPPQAEKEYVRMIYALWSALKPFLRDHSQAALRSFVKKMTGVDKPDWLSPEDANDVIEGLKAWLARERDKRTQRRTGSKPARLHSAGKQRH